MELRQLRYFVAVAEELHFGRAAVRVHIAQPPLSQQIKALEDELGVTLLVRSSRKVELTPAGRVFLDEARAILAASTSAVANARRTALGLRGLLQIGFMGPALDSFLAEAVGIYRQCRPEVELVLTEQGSMAQLKALDTRCLDLAFIRHVQGDHAGVVQQVVFREPYVLALPDEHTLAALTIVPAALLDLQPLVFFPRAGGPVLYDAMLAALAAAGAVPRIVQEVASKRSAMALVAAGVGLALVPASSAAWSRDGVTFRRLEAGLPEVEMAAAWRVGGLWPASAALVTIACELGGLG